MSRQTKVNSLSRSTMFRQRSRTGSNPASRSFSSGRSKSLPLQGKVDSDDNKYGFKKGKNWSSSDKRGTALVVILAVLYLLKRMNFPLSHEQLDFVDRSVRNMWVKAEQWGIMEQFPVYTTDYFDDFPYFSLLEENYEIIREEALNLLETNRNRIPRLKDLVESKRSIGKVYKTDWKTCT